MTAAGHLARAVARSPYDDWSPRARERLHAVVTDVIATMVAGASRPELAALRDALCRGDGPSTVVGAAHGSDPATAALLNGMPVAAEQLQDGHRLARGHPGSHVVPAVLSCAEAYPRSGRALLSAVNTGYEVGVRIGVAMGGTPTGVHDIATWGSLGAAAGVAHLLTDGDADTVAAAIDLAASAPVLSDARNVFEGASGHLVFLGLGAQAGVVWGSAAAVGTRALPGTLERHFAACAAADFDAARLTRDERDEPAVLGGYLKRHPTCAHLHGVNDAVEQLVHDYDMEPGNVAQVEVSTYAAATQFAEPHPANPDAARFSIPFTVAAAIVTGGLDADVFTSTLLADPQVRSLSDRIVVRHDPELDAGYPRGRPARVVVRMRDGVVHEAIVDRPRGDGPGALDDVDVRDKPRRLLTARLGAARANALLEAVEHLAETGVEPLTEALRATAEPE